MSQLIKEAKRMQQLAGIITESQLNELDANVQKLRDGFFKKLDAFAKAYVALANDGEDNGLFKVDKGAEQKWNAFSDAFDVAHKQWGPLYQYIKGDLPPQLGGSTSKSTPGAPPRAAAPPPPSGPKNAPPRRPIPPPPPNPTSKPPQRRPPPPPPPPSGK